MEYTVKKMAQLSGVSARTLRYYDEIGLLLPTRVNSSGYRIYGQSEVDRLQQILFYRELGLKLEEIKVLLDNPDFNVEQALRAHQQKLLEKRAEIDRLLETVQQTIKHYKGEIQMTDQEKFTAFKKQQIAENERQYGTEIREKYGEERIEQSNQKYLKLTEAELAEMGQTEQQMMTLIASYLENPVLPSETAQQIYECHKKWLNYSWPSYSGEAHKGLTEMYVGDERFTAYYDQKVIGSAQVLYDVIHFYA